MLGSAGSRASVSLQQPPFSPLGNKGGAGVPPPPPPPPPAFEALPAAAPSHAVPPPPARSPFSAPPPAAPHSLTYRELLRRAGDPRVLSTMNAGALEEYLAPEEFSRVLEVDPPAFRRLPQWQQTALRKKTRLFVAALA
jgi:hypothetical protein